MRINLTFDFDYNYTTAITDFLATLSDTTYTIHDDTEITISTTADNLPAIADFLLGKN